MSSIIFIVSKVLKHKLNTQNSSDGYKDMDNVTMITLFNFLPVNVILLKRTVFFQKHRHLHMLAQYLEVRSKLLDYIERKLGTRIFSKYIEWISN